MSRARKARSRLRVGGVSAARVTFLLIILLLVLVSIGLVVASPWALRALDGSQLDWNRLSNIGQTYGAVSAIIAAVALLGVVSSLIIQSREAKADRVNAQRAHHTELMRMAMDDPKYMECWGPYLTESFVTERQDVYINLIVAQWYTAHEIGELNDVLLRATAAPVFASVPGRRYWEASGAFWRDNYSGRRARRFYRILDEAYREAIKKPPAAPPAFVANKKPPAAPPAFVANKSVPDSEDDRLWVAAVLSAAIFGVASFCAVVVYAVYRFWRRAWGGR